MGDSIIDRFDALIREQWNLPDDFEITDAWLSQELHRRDEQALAAATARAEAAEATNADLRRECAVNKRALQMAVLSACGIAAGEEPNDKMEKLVPGLVDSAIELAEANLPPDAAYTTRVEAITADRDDYKIALESCALQLANHGHSGDVAARARQIYDDCLAEARAERSES